VDFPGEKLVTRLWETIAEKGVGSLLRPWQIRREGRARLDVRREEILKLAQAERDADDIRSGSKQLTEGGQLLGLPQSTPESARTAGARTETEFLDVAFRTVNRNLLVDAVRREVNVARAVLAAEAELQDDAQEPPPRKLDDDWLYRWRESAGAVSAEELQNLWGRVLAGEIKSPGAFSLRTLEFLKNLSQAEAAAISKISRFVVADAIYRGDENLLKAEGLTYGFLLGMQQLGILSGVEALGLSLTLKSNEPGRFSQALVSHNQVIVVSHEDASKQLKISPVCQVTGIGRQILRLGTFESHDGYLRSLGQSIKNQGFRVQLARYQQVTETEGSYSDAQDL
jgi:hypothetical protein